MSCQSSSLNKNTGGEGSLQEARLCLCDPYLTGPVSYSRQSALTGPTDKPLYERGHLDLWNPSSALCLAQLTNGFKQHSGSFRKVFHSHVCLQIEQEKGTKRGSERERREKKWDRRERCISEISEPKQNKEWEPLSLNWLLTLAKVLL